MEFGKQTWVQAATPTQPQHAICGKSRRQGVGGGTNACQMLNVFPQWPKHTRQTKQDKSFIAGEARSLPDLAWLTDFCGWQWCTESVPQCHSATQTAVHNREQCHSEFELFVAHCDGPFIFPFPFAVSCLLLAYLCCETYYQIEVQYTQISLSRCHSHAQGHKIIAFQCHLQQELWQPQLHSSGLRPSN